MTIGNTQKNYMTPSRLFLGQDQTVTTTTSTPATIDLGYTFPTADDPLQAKIVVARTGAATGVYGLGATGARGLILYGGGPSSGTSSTVTARGNFNVDSSIRLNRNIIISSATGGPRVRPNYIDIGPEYAAAANNPIAAKLALFQAGLNTAYGFGVSSKLGLEYFADSARGAHTFHGRVSVNDDSTTLTPGYAFQVNGKSLLKDTVMMVQAKPITWAADPLISNKILLYDNGATTSKTGLGTFGSGSAGLAIFANGTAGSPLGIAAGVGFDASNLTPFNGAFGINTSNNIRFNKVITNPGAPIANRTTDTVFMIQRPSDSGYVKMTKTEVSVMLGVSTSLYYKPFTVISSGSPYQATANDYQIVTQTSSAYTVNLPQANLNSGREYRIKNISTGTTTVTATGSSLLPGEQSTLVGGESLTYLSIGTYWIVVAH